MEVALKLYVNTPKEKIEEIEKYGTEFHKLLIAMLKKFRNNKDKTNINITDIKSIDHLREILNDVAKAYDKYKKLFHSHEIWVLHNSYEYFIYKPYTFKASKYFGYDEKRDNNWCTTYSPEYFKEYLGKYGGLLYVINKYDESKCYALRFSPLSDEIEVWDYENKNYYTGYSLENVIEVVWDSKEEPYDVLMKNIKKLEDDVVKIDYYVLRKRAKEYYKNCDIIELFDIVGTNIFMYVNDEMFLNDMKNDLRNVYLSDWKYEDLNYHFPKFIKEIDNNTKKTIFKYFIDNYSDEIRETLNIDEEKDIEISHIEKFIEKCNIDYIRNAIMDLKLVEKFSDYLVEYYYGDYDSAEKFIYNMYDGDIDMEEVIFKIKKYIDYDELINDIVDNLSDRKLYAFS